MATKTTNDYKEFAAKLNSLLKSYNYHVAPTALAGKVGKGDKSMREFRLQLINKSNDTSDRLIKDLEKIVRENIQSSANIKYNSISPNSSKFPSVSFTFDGQSYDLVIARGANRGENFETSTVANLASFFNTRKQSDTYLNLIELMNNANKQFAAAEIKSVKQRKGSTKKTGVAIEKLGAVIGDIILTDTANNPWYISLKDVNGTTFSSYPGAGSLFNSAGDIQPNSEGAEFLKAFGVDLNMVQAGFDMRRNVKKIRSKIPVSKANPKKITSIFEHAWGMNYFYVRRMNGNSWQVFWIDRDKLNRLSRNIKIDEIKYPSPNSKQITIKCSNNEKAYQIEIRNSAGGEFPNDIKIKLQK